MPYNIVWEERGASTKFTGKITIDEINQANDEHYGDPRYDDIKYQLFDFTSADLSAITLDDAKYPAAIDKAANTYKLILKVALVAKDDYAKTLCREYINLSMQFNSTWVFGVFDSYKKAKDWCSL